jgi:hypothetical protein
MATKRRRGKSAVSGFVRSTKTELGLFEVSHNSSEPELYPVRRCQNKYILTSAEQEELVEISRHVLSKMLTSPFNLLFKSSPQDHFIFNETASLTTEFIDDLVARRPSHFPKELHSPVEAASLARKRRKVKEPLIEAQASEEEVEESEEEYLELPQEDEEVDTRGMFEEEKEESSSSESEAVL